MDLEVEVHLDCQVRLDPPRHGLKPVDLGLQALEFRAFMQKASRVPERPFHQAKPAGLLGVIGRFGKPRPATAAAGRTVDPPGRKPVATCDSWSPACVTVNSSGSGASAPGCSPVQG